MSLISLAGYKAFIDIPADDTRKDTQLAVLITAAEKRALRWLNRELEKPAEAVTEYFDGDGTTRFIFPRYYPLVSVTSLHDDTERSYGDDRLISSDDYVIYSDYIELDGFAFTRGLKNIKLVYLGGYVTSGESANVPEDLQEALYKLVSWNAQRIGREALNSQAAADMNISTNFIVEIPKDIKQELAPWRKIPL